MTLFLPSPSRKSQYYLIQRRELADITKSAVVVNLYTSLV